MSVLFLEESGFQAKHNEILLESTKVFPILFLKHSDMRPSSTVMEVLCVE